LLTPFGLLHLFALFYLEQTMKKRQNEYCKKTKRRLPDGREVVTGFMRFGPGFAKSNEQKS
tara:strand:+ start:7946 stop:8128 length:183 start_codon:yes stop_codon:yes gene_type:complete